MIAAHHSYQDTEADLYDLEQDKETFDKLLQLDQKKWNLSIKQIKPKLAEIVGKYQA